MSLSAAIATPGKLRIVFDVNGTITHEERVRPKSNKTVDGRGRTIRVEGQIQLKDVSNIILSDISVENSLEGAVTRTLDRFIDVPQTHVQIHGEIEEPIHHFLIRHRTTPVEEVRVVYSHPQALAQCRKWLHQHLPRIVQRETNSTADAVQYVLQDATGAAIGRQELVQRYGGLVAAKIPDARDNKTRFLVLGLGTAPRGKQHKTSLLIALKDAPGALHDALVPFKTHKLNLTKIESRPSKKKAWEYLFLIDVEGHQADPKMRRALAALKKNTTRFQVLGSYPMMAS